MMQEARLCERLTDQALVSMDKPWAHVSTDVLLSMISSSEVS